MDYWLLVISYWLLVIGYWLLVIGYWLLVIGYWLLVIGPTVNCQLSTKRALTGHCPYNCQLSTVNCQLSTVNCQLSTVNCQLYPKPNSRLSKLIDLEPM
ncbi:hypothetical protein [Microcoleus sp. PH2017_36_ELK_O_B]|uniref:hypothetical protein n=1 Tax=Microcoleus sp. PH2017_36_ELK_O_B TaxID=2798846 RepID=UPI0025FC2B0A|nr:hypothetical protein [Microcoleus sp. PH2017_36_ELK_O_B]